MGDPPNTEMMIGLARTGSRVSRAAAQMPRVLPMGTLSARPCDPCRDTGIDKLGIYKPRTVHHNLSYQELFEHEVANNEGYVVKMKYGDTFGVDTGRFTGRSPQDKYFVRNVGTESDANLWWGSINQPTTPLVFDSLYDRAISYFNTLDEVYVFDGFTGSSPKSRKKVRFVHELAWQQHFVKNMFIRKSGYGPVLTDFVPDYTIINACGTTVENWKDLGLNSEVAVAFNIEKRVAVIFGTWYGGENKKGIFSLMNYWLPMKGIMAMHCSANVGPKGDSALFFGLSGTGKTTLSADPNRALIGDDEHCWSDRGVFNIEGGCYAKCIGLSAEKEPDIFGAIKFGSVLENVVFSPETRLVDYDDSTLTENTRCAYPIEYIENAKIPCLSENHPSNIILLTCDARGVLPPISKLNSAQTMFHFISGYTSKMAGTEDGVTEPQATFSSCFAQPFLALHPMRYAKMLADKIEQHKANAWLLNTGWVGAGALQGGKRCPLKYTRAILDAIHSGELAKVEYENYEVFNLQVPKTCPNVPDELLNPKKAWTAGDDSFNSEVTKLGGLFVENFKKYSDEATEDVIKAGPAVSA